MKITVSEIPEEGLDIDITEKMRSDSVAVVSPVRASLRIEKTASSEVLVRGTVNADMELQCSRCLRPFVVNVKSEIEVVYHPAASISRDEHYELKSDELDMSFYKNDTLDTDEILEEQLLLNVPMKPLCSSDCKGICPKCGIDLNAGDCTCDFTETDPRLKVLEKLLKRKE